MYMRLLNVITLISSARLRQYHYKHLNAIPIVNIARLSEKINVENETCVHYVLEFHLL